MNSIQEAAHKVVLLGKLMRKLDFQSAKVCPMAPDYWAISFQINYAAVHSYSRLKKIGADNKTHHFLTSNKDIARLYRRSTVFPNSKSTIGLVDLMPNVGSKDELLGKAALFDILTIDMPYGFAWKDKRFFEKPGELELTLAKFDIAYSQLDADIEDGIVDLIQLHELLAK